VGKVLVVYGNGSSAAGCAHYADDFQKLAALNVFILDYPGYEDRPGKPTEKSLFQAADEALPLLGTNGPVYLMGESLGTGVAAYLAGSHAEQIAGVVLIAPYNRLTAAAQIHYPFLPVRLLMLDHFPSEDYLWNYHGPVGILVGGKDQVVPERLGRRLYDGYNGPKQLWEFPQDGHGDLFQRLPDVWNQLAILWHLNQTASTGK
jgi:pimeloyl-ACP methyl ester carboxylesterase